VCKQRDAPYRVVPRPFKVDDDDFTSAEARHNVLVFAARARAVKRERFGNYVGGLERKLDNQDGSTAAYFGFVEGERLDATVRSDRLGFEIDEDEDDLFEGSKSLSLIRDGALDAVREDLGAVLGKIRARKEEAVHQYVAEQAPEYRRLVKTQKDRVLEALPANPKKREIDAALGRVLLERQADLKEEGKALLAFEPETDTLEKYKQQMEGFYRQVRRPRSNRPCPTRDQPADRPEPSRPGIVAG
jgi:hypothetical protein